MSESGMEWAGRLRRFYTDHLQEVILPYWMERADSAHGGFFTCYDVTGMHLVSTDKYVWSQGRCTWLYARLAGGAVPGLDEMIRRRCAELAAQGAAFLQEKCILPSGRAAFLLAADGTPKEPWPGSGPAVSGFADCFAAMGLAAWGALAQNDAALDRAFALFEGAAKLAQEGAFPTAPDVLPTGWQAHAVPMILVNTGLELAAALKTAGRTDQAQRAQSVARWGTEQITRRFLQPGGVIAECIDAGGRVPDTLYGRHLNPGHTFECVWFLLDAAGQLGLPELASTAERVCLNLDRLAWDDDCGGFFYYIDRQGGPPQGPAFAPEQALAGAAVRDWAHKLWWPQVEALCANLWCFKRTGELEYRQWFERCHTYTFSTFPNPNRAVREWLQLRDRQGRPLEGPVGGRLPVKDPYHIPRGLMVLIRTLGQMEQQ